MICCCSMAGTKACMRCQLNQMEYGNEITIYNYDSTIVDTERLHVRTDKESR
jgi:hypothetical protein